MKEIKWVAKDDFKVTEQTKRNGCLRASRQGGGHVVHRTQNAITHTKCDRLPLPSWCFVG